MHKVIKNQESGKQDTDWVFLADCSLDELKQRVKCGDEPTSGLRFQNVDIPFEYLNKVLLTLVDFPHQQMRRTRPGTLAMIRLFCQKKLITTENQDETVSPKQTVAGSEIIPPAVPKIGGGCGYFLIERNANYSEDQPAGYQKFMDLYFFREGK